MKIIWLKITTKSLNNKNEIMYTSGQRQIRAKKRLRGKRWSQCGANLYRNSWVLDWKSWILDSKWWIFYWKSWILQGPSSSSERSAEHSKAFPGVYSKSWIVYSKIMNYVFKIMNALPGAIRVWCFENDWSGETPDLAPYAEFTLKNLVGFYTD